MKRPLEEMYERAIRTAKIKGHHDVAEDFAGWITVRWLEGKSQHQTLDQSLIDFLRSEYGSSRGRCGADALLRARRKPQTLVSGLDSGAAEEALERMLASRSDSKSNDPTAADVERLNRDPRHYLPTRLAEVWHLYANEELDLAAIGREFNVSESRACQLLGSAKNCIERFEGIHAMSERIEEGRSVFSVEWVTL